MAMIGIFTQTNIGDEQQVRNRLLRFSQASTNDSLLCEGGGSDRVLQLFGRNPEQHHGRNPQIMYLEKFLSQPIHRKSELPGHGADLFANSPVRHEGTSDRRAGRR